MLGAQATTEQHIRDNGLRSNDGYNGPSDQERCVLEYHKRVWDIQYKRIHSNHEQQQNRLQADQPRYEILFQIQGRDNITVLRSPNDEIPRPFRGSQPRNQETGLDKVQVQSSL